MAWVDGRPGARYERLAENTLTFLRVQADAGVSAVQLFDSWAGALSEADYREYVLPVTAIAISTSTTAIARGISMKVIGS